MRKFSGQTPGISLFLLIALMSVSGLVSCRSLPNGTSGAQNKHVAIDWVDFIRFHGITYVATVPTPGGSIAANGLGPLFATVAFKLDGNVQDPNYHSKDGDAALLNAGTKIYSLKGYRTTFRLAAYENNTLALYEVDSNPAARVGADLLDIGGKVHSIGILSAQDGVTELGAIKDATQVNQLVATVLKAPVEQNEQTGQKRYFLAFHLTDGTVVTRPYWLDTGVLGRGIHLPAAFGQTIQEALKVGR